MAKQPTTSSDSGNEYTEPVGINNIGDGLDKVLESTKAKVTNESSAAVATPTEVDNVVTTVLQTKKIAVTPENFSRALATLAHLVQMGATSPKFAASRMVTDYGLDIKAGDLRDACNKNGITVRKFARGIRNEVVKVASRFQIEGNLAKNYKIENPSCDAQDLIWVSDFQTFSNNPAMPDHVRQWLLQNYKSRFRPS